MLGSEEVTAAPSRSLVTLPLEDLDAYPFTSSIDDLYWCFRQIQAREAWDIHGEWIMERPRNLGPGVDERFGFGRTVDPRKLRTEQVRRYTLRAELLELLGNDAVLVMPTVPGAAPLKSASADTLKNYREAALAPLLATQAFPAPQIRAALIGMVDDAPGLSLLGPPDSDVALIRLGRRILANAGTWSTV